VEALEREGRASAVADESLQFFAVCGLDVDAPIEAKTAALIPGQHVPGVVGLQEAVTTEMSQDPGTATLSAPAGTP